MSVPPDRMAPVRPAGDPNKIMGVPKPVFYIVLILGLILAFYIWRRSKSNPPASDVAAGTQPSDTTNGVTAADIGGTPSDNSFATNTDMTAIEEQIKSLQDSLFQLQQSNGGNGAGLPDPSSGGTKTPGGGIPTPTPITFPFPGVNTGPPVTATPSPVGIHWFGPGGSGVSYPETNLTTTPQTNPQILPPAPQPVYGNVGAHPAVAS